MRHLQTQSANYPVDEFPPQCPRCSRMIAAIFSGALSDQDNSTYLEAIFKCPHCLLYFVGYYSRDYGANTHTFRRSLPRTPLKEDFPLIDLVSERFAEIYNQSVAAEEYGLGDIAGSGYRKALEFLVKDFCISLDPQNAEIIKKKFLKNVIDDHLGDGKLKRVATLTAWLGNDEGHYERRWVDKDLADLKALLALTITFVNEEIQTEQYIQSMQPATPKRLQLKDVES